MRLTPEQSAELVIAASQGDRRAWEGLVEAYAGLVWAIIRNHRLGPSDASDVSQTTWLRLVENIGRIQDPSRVGAWLATTTRRECLRVIGQSRRVVLLANAEEYDSASPHVPGVDHALLAAERDDGVRRGLEQLSPRCQQLLHLLMLDPPPSYEEVSAAMAIPIGSIGPTRGRCLARLHEILAASGTAEPGRRSMDM
ncbi:MAG: polymerase, sigma-24 subunit, subfamily [Frankiales bacterium]|nr:polymerase, sigma-24 subunit, subfamily [Frankiales bacterium]